MSTKEQPWSEQAAEIGGSAFESIKEMVQALTAARESENERDIAAAEETITMDPLSLQFRSGWSNHPDEFEAEEFELLLSTGGPAVRIIGEIENGQAAKPRLQVQDWFQPWTDYACDEDVLLAYCNCFCFEV